MTSRTRLTPHFDPQTLVELFERFDSALSETWGKAMRRTLASGELDSKTAAIVTLGTRTVVRWSPTTIEEEVNHAIRAGASVAEIIEAIVHLSSLEGGAHSLHLGLEAMERVICKRGKDGLDTPLCGVALGPRDMIREAPWPNPPVFPYQSPSPRYHNQVLIKYHPALWEAFKAWNDARFRLRKDLTRKTQEFLSTACDTAILWRQPLIDHHIHVAFEVGATAQEILEVVILAAAAAQRASDSSLAGRLEAGGVQALHHGLTALDRVLRQRESHDLLAPRDKTQPRTGRVALTEVDVGPVV